MSVEVSLISNEKCIKQKTRQFIVLIMNGLYYHIFSFSRQQVVSSRQTTVIGAAANSGSGRNLSPSRPAPKAAPKREFSGIVIGLRHDRRKRLIMPFDDFMY